MPTNIAIGTQENNHMLSVCIITKNEEHNLARCLKSFQNTGFELVVVDTGSTDQTKKIAAEYTENIYDFPWCDDFSAAKNFAVSKATHPYVMVIDSDEYLQKIDLSRLEKMIVEHPGEVGRIQRINIISGKDGKQENKEWINRIFAKESFHYTGRIHEQVTAYDEKEYRTYEAPVLIGHTGYDLPKKEKKAKALRNIRLLEQELKNSGWDAKVHATQLEQNLSKQDTDAEQKSEIADAKKEQQIPYLLYQLGKSYYMAEDYDEACFWFAHGLSYDLEPKLEYVIDMVETYGYALINSGRAGEALFFENIYEEFGNSADFQFLMGLIYMNNAMFDAAVGEFLKAVRHRDCRMAGVNSYAAYYNVGVIYECLGKISDAKYYYQKCGGYEPAKKHQEFIKKICGIDAEERSAAISSKRFYLSEASENRRVFERLFNLYIYEMSSYAEWMGECMTEDALFIPDKVSEYFEMSEKQPFIIKVKGKIAGLIVFLVPDREREPDEADFYIEELFILKAYRKQHIAEELIEAVWSINKGICSVCALKANKGSVKFWKKVIKKSGYECEVKDMDDVYFYNIKIK